MDNRMTEIETLQTQLIEMKHALDRSTEEKVKLGINYEKSLEERAELEKKIEFLLGQIEAYKFCVENIRR